MTGAAPSTTRIDLRSSLSRFVESGVAIWKPDSGSVFEHSGPDALDLLHRITTNSLIDMPNGATRQTILTNEKGRIIDTPWVIKLAPDNLLLVSDAPNPQALHDGISRFTIIEDAELTDITNECARFMVFGEQATTSILQAYPHADVSRVSDFVELDKDGEIKAFRTDVAGVTTWMIIASFAMADELPWRFGSLGITVSHRSLFDYIRIKNRVPIAGIDLTEKVNPLEASMQHLIDFDKGCYVGQEVIARLDTYDKVQRKLVAIRDGGCSGDQGEIETDDRIVTIAGGRDIGWVSSVADDPVTRSRFGLAYVRGRYVEGVDVELASGGEGISLLA